MQPFQLFLSLTSCDEGFAGLSRLMKPWLMKCLMGLFRGEQPASSGV